MAIRVGNDGQAIETSKPFETSEFRVAVDSRTFKALSDGIYSRKIRAVIRELSTNAVDAHIAAGHTRPFEVRLPGWDFPYFVIRDFGPGLSHDEVMSLYVTYFQSGEYKLKSNDYVGCLGLGSKSPFALSKSFNVASYYNGIKSTYTAYIGEDGCPAISKLASVPTDQPNGLEIMVQVESNQVNEFRSEAQDIYRYFTIKPRFVGPEKDHVAINPIIYRHQGKGWGVRNDNFRSGNAVRAIMGSVYYPIDVRELHGLTTSQQRLMNQPIDITFDIGDLSPTLSREKVEYGKNDVANIKKRLDEILDEIQAIINKEIATCKSTWQACGLYNALADGHDMMSIFASIVDIKTLTWNGNPLPVRPFFTVKPIDGVEILVWRRRSYRKSVKSEATDQITPRRNNIPIVYYDDMKRGQGVRCRHLVKSDKAPVVYLITGNYQEHLKEITQQLGMLEDGSELAPISSVASPNANYSGIYYGPRKTGAKHFTFVDNGCTAQHEQWKESKVDMEKGGIYVVMERYSIVTPDLKVVKPDIIKDFVTFAAKFDKTIEVVGVRKSALKYFADNPKWINIFDYVGQLAKRVVTDKAVVSTILDAREALAYHNHTWIMGIVRCDREYGINKGKAAKIIEKLRQFETNRLAYPTDVRDTIERVLVRFGHKINGKPTVSLKKADETLKTNFPMLEYVDCLGEARARKDVANYLNAG